MVKDLRLQPYEVKQTLKWSVTSSFSGTLAFPGLDPVRWPGRNTYLLHNGLAS